MSRKKNLISYADTMYKICIFKIILCSFLFFILYDHTWYIKKSSKSSPKAMSDSTKKCNNSSKGWQKLRVAQRQGPLLAQLLHMMGSSLSKKPKFCWWYYQTTYVFWTTPLCMIFMILQTPLIKFIIFVIF